MSIHNPILDAIKKFNPLTKFLEERKLLKNTLSELSNAGISTKGMDKEQLKSIAHRYEYQEGQHRADKKQPDDYQTDEDYSKKSKEEPIEGMVGVSSSNVSAVGVINGRLHVRYKDGSEYEYKVPNPQEVAKDMIAAPSVGKYRWNVLGDPRHGNAVPYEEVTGNHSPLATYNMSQSKRK